MANLRKQRGSLLGFGLCTVMVLGGCSSSKEPESFSTVPAETTAAAETTVVADETTEAASTETTPEQVAETTATAAPVQDLQIESGFTSEVNSIGTQHASAGAVVTNPNAKAACNVKIVFTLKDAAGVGVDTDTVSIDQIPAGGRALAAPLQIGFDKPKAESLQTTFVVDSYADKCDASFFSKGIVLEVSGVTVAPSDYSGMAVKAQVKNPSDKVAEFSSISCVLRLGGKIVGGLSTGITDPIVPGNTIAWNSTADATKAADAAECQASA